MKKSDKYEKAEIIEISKIAEIFSISSKSLFFFFLTFSSYDLGLKKSRGKKSRKIMNKNCKQQLEL